jgi:farnesyl diphosphate synthase
MQTTIGQALDLETGTHNTKAELFDFGEFSQENYATIVRWKTGFYSFYLPIACALYLVGFFLKQKKKFY